MLLDVEDIPCFVGILADIPVGIFSFGVGEKDNSIYRVLSVLSVFCIHQGLRIFLCRSCCRSLSVFSYSKGLRGMNIPPLSKWSQDRQNKI